MIAVRFSTLEVFLAPSTWLNQLRTLMVLGGNIDRSIVAVNTAAVDEIWYVGKAWWR